MQHTVRALRTKCSGAFTNRTASAFVMHLKHKQFSTEAKPGVLGSMRKAYDTAIESREEKTQEKIFKTQMKYLSSDTPFTPQVFLKLLEQTKADAGLSGMKKHLPWVANNEAMKDFEQQEAILKSLTPAEQQSSRSLPIGVKKRAARITGADLWMVDSLFTQVESMHSMQIFLRKMTDSGRALPESSDELKIMTSQMGQSGRRKGKGRSRMPRPGVKNPRQFAR